MKIGIFFNGAQVDAATVTNLTETLAKRGAKTQTFSRTEELSALSADCLLVLGGDGTVLRAAKYAGEVPVMGINFGTLGFLTEFDRTEIASAVDSLFTNKLKPYFRSMLETERNGNKSYCLNELALFHRIREQSGGIARMEMKIDGAFAGTVAADGLIISTPTGSTAYSLSAGGCVLAPDCGTFLITPVCSFSLNSRPVVFSDDSELTVRTGSEMSVVEDGSSQGETIIGDEITVRKASRKVCFLAREKSGFYRKLAQKISEL